MNTWPNGAPPAAWQGPKDNRNLTQKPTQKIASHTEFMTLPRQAKDEVIAWLLWYNQTRLHSTLAYVSPVRFEQNWLAAQAMQVNS